jgi:hypothetical protein
MFGSIIHRNLFIGFDDPNRDIVPVGASGVRVTGVIDEPRWRPHQDVLTVDDRKENPLFLWKSLDRFVAQYFPASINDDVARLKASCRKNPSSVNWRVMYDYVLHVPREYRWREGFSRAMSRSPSQVFMRERDNRARRRRRRA